MNKTIIVFLLCFFIHIHYSQAKQRELKKGTAVVFGADVLLRALPSESGNIVDVLPIASKIEIIDKASLNVNLGNINDYWYKVKYNEEDGFIWGPLIADNYYEGDLDQDGSTETFMVLDLTKESSDADFNSSTSKIELRVARNGQMIIEHKQFSEIRLEIDTLSFDKLAKFTPDLSVIRVKYSFSGISGGKKEQILRFKNNNIDSLFTVNYAEGDGGIICLSELVLPSDKGGQANSLIIKTKCADVSACDYISGNPPCSWEYYNKTWVWDGIKFTSK